MTYPFQPYTPWELGVKREINALQDRVRDLESAVRERGASLDTAERSSLVAALEAAERARDVALEKIGDVLGRAKNFESESNSLRNGLRTVTEQRDAAERECDAVRAVADRYRKALERIANIAATPSDRAIAREALGANS